MNNWSVVSAAAATAAACLSGCSATPPSPAQASGGLPPNTARVIVDGKDLGITDVICTQVGWMWTITTGDEGSASTAVIETGGGPMVARSVRFRQVDGFSGSYWDGNHGNAKASIVADNWTITGDVEGFNIDGQGIDHATRQFTISANC